MTDLPTLISRLEAADGPSRELDAEIAVSVFVTLKTDDDLIYAHRRDPGNDATHPGHYFIKSRSGAQAQSAPRYTSSLDAALMLVRSMGFYWMAAEGRTRPDEPLGAVQLYRRDTREIVAEAEHEYVEIALCIAALRARSAEQGMGL